MKIVRWKQLCLVSAAVLAWGDLATAAEQGMIEEVVVTAQKRAESIQDVPISVSAFDAGALDKYQIDTFSDLQFNVPNVSFSKTNFSGNNFQIRGIGTLLTAASADSGVGMHVNDVYLNAPLIFETEYYDMAQVEILRGPQGTLFGRNATGGVVNMKTARPDFEALSFDIDAQIGNYDHRKVKGAVNIPISDSIAARIAGIWLDREGYTDNLLTGNDVDGREQWSVRGSLRFDMGDNTRLDLIAHTFDEDSNRSRSQKQLCHQDPSAVLGCIPDTLPTEPINAMSTAGNLLSSNLLLGPLGIFDFFDSPPNEEANNPSDMRKVRLQFEPTYEAEEDFFMAELKHEFSNDLTFTAIGAYQEAAVLSRQDYNGTAADTGAAALPAGFCSFSPAACAYFGMTEGGPVFVSSVPNKDTSLGAIAGPGEFHLTSRGSALDLSDFEADQTSFEFRIASNYGEGFDFLLAAYFMEFESSTNYFVQAPGLDYPSIVLANGAFAGNPDQFLSLAPGYFNNETEAYELDSLGLFGEVYFQLSDNLKLTVGLRYTEDDKAITDRQVFLNVPVMVDVASGTTTFLGSDGSATPVSTIDDLITAAAATGDYDADPNVPGGQVYRENDLTFDAYTGRIVLDWMPEVSFTDDTMVYFSYSRGYKGGGINPGIDANLFPNTPVGFDNEDIDAFEIGTKNTLWDSRAQINASVFYYDYGGLQIGKIVNRTSLNENTDAEVFGMESEFIIAPTENWMFNAQISYLNTELKDTKTIDPRDPTQGRQDVSLFKDFVDASNCVVEQNGLGPVSDNGTLVATIQGAGAPYFPTGRDLGAFGGVPGTIIPTTPGVTDSAFTSCAAIQAIAPLFGYTYQDSIGTNLNGNELIQSPEWTINLGAQYTWFLNNGMSLSGRLDYYWQDEFYATTFNRPQDLIDSWDVFNAQATLTSADEKWTVTAFIQNIEDDDEMTGHYQTDPSSGLFTNAFFVEPQLYGVSFRWRH
jgi:outer membrane receptor protein involved in Fe transport